ncbi:MAG: gamma-glutamyl-gamma-aminobutyrate hydrolase family protein [Tissierellia bacterium]|nr:gamma-glutamyl-gamma-aminobutyrate hydrolase family protein [Tissierellia bacterium]
MSKPIIAITPNYDTGEKRYYLSEAMLSSIWDNGGIPLPLPLTQDFKEEDYEALLRRVDGIVFTGGCDFPATYYGEENSEYLSSFAPLRDLLEFALMPMVLELDLPVLAICRGMQLGNVVLGGSLYQDLPKLFSDEISHEIREGEDYGKVAHGLSTRGETDQLAREFFGTTELRVNSLHHQGIKDMAEDLVPLLWAEDGLVEAYYHPGKRFFLGLQWHPEYMYEKEESSRRTLEGLVAAARVYGEQKEQ